MARRRFPHDFKLGTLRLDREQDVSVAQETAI